MSFGTLIRVTDPTHPFFERLGAVYLPCKDGRYIVAVDRLLGQQWGTPTVLRADQLEVLR